jgi:hypothetical protein
MHVENFTFRNLGTCASGHLNSGNLRFGTLDFGTHRFPTYRLPHPQALTLGFDIRRLGFE